MLNLFLLCLLGNSRAQGISDTIQADTLYVVTKNDGVEYIGKILSDDGREILLETETLGKIYIAKSHLRSIVMIKSDEDIVHGEYRSEGAFTTRYAFTTNAFPIKKGENYAMINLYGPEVHFALTDNLNIGVMSTWIASPTALALKYSIPTDNKKIRFSLGTLMGTSGYINSFRGFGGLHFINATFGDRKKSLTLSTGYSYLKTGGTHSYYEPGTYYYSGYNANIPSSSRDVPVQHGPIFSIAGIAPVGAKASFVFDSMFGIFSSIRNNREYSTVVEPAGGYYDPNPPYEYIPSTPGEYEVVVSDVKTTQLALFVMPGMRFQTRENRAFQVSLAGVSLFRVKGFGYDSVESLPLPMCTWFFKF